MIGLESTGAHFALEYLRPRQRASSWAPIGGTVRPTPTPRQGRPRPHRAPATPRYRGHYDTCSVGVQYFGTSVHHFQETLSNVPACSHSAETYRDLSSSRTNFILYPSDPDGYCRPKPSESPSIHGLTSRHENRHLQRSSTRLITSPKQALASCRR